jgi:hypothetical protein
MKAARLGSGTENAFNQSIQREARRERLNGGTINLVKITFDPAKRQAALGERDFADAAIVLPARRSPCKTRGGTMARLASRRLDFLLIEW